MMKKYISIIFITLAVAGSSCKKNYLDLSTNPNVPSSSSPGLLLTGALKGTADIVNGPNMLTTPNPPPGLLTTVGTGYVMYAAWVGYLSQSTGFQPFVALEQYQFTTSTYDEWTPNYLNISNYAGLAASTTEPNYLAIAKIMTAFDYESLVDNYNNVPYTTATKGTSNLNPTYQNGVDIYADLMKQLDAAITMIQGAPATAANPAGADIMFAGNMTKWIKFANTLKLRLAVRESTNPAIASSYATLKAAATATAGLGYLDATTAATLNPGYLSSDADNGQQSPLYRNYGFTATGTTQTNNNEYQANSFAANFYASNGDPRLIRVYAPTASAAAVTTPAPSLLAGSAVNQQLAPDGTIQAVVSTTFGDSQPPTTTNGAGLTPSKVGAGVLPGPTMNATIMSSEEALFLQAEAANLGIIPGSAQSFYEAGITASFVDLNAQTVTGAAPNVVVSSPTASAAALFAPGGPYAWPADAVSQEKAIITQKWAALAVAGAFEAFNEERRTGYPNVPTSIYPGANAPNQVTRILYPFVEYSTNAANVAAQGTINIFTSKIFWAQ